MPSPRVQRARRTGAAAASVAAAALVLAACSGTPATTSDETAATAASSGAFPVTITHVYGETVITAEPTKVATIGWGSLDAAVALGVVPVATGTSSFGDTDDDGFLAWSKDAIEALGKPLPALHDEFDGAPYEAISDSGADLILAPNSGISEQEYTTLSKIAPTVAYPLTPWGTPWRETTTMVGAALGKADDAKQLITDTEQTIADEMAKYPQTTGKSAMVIWVDAKDTGKVQYYTTNDTRARFLADLGFTTPAGIEELSAGQDSFVASISAEEADRLDADIAVVFVQGGDLSTLTDDPLLSKIPAVASGAVAFLQDDETVMAISSPTVLSIPWLMPSYAKLLGDAAAKAE